MKIQQRAVLHNRFDVKVVEKAPQAAKSSRRRSASTSLPTTILITDNWFTTQVKRQIYFGILPCGTGTGTPLRIPPFSHLTRKAVTTLETVYEYPTSYTTKQIKLEATECNGSTVQKWHSKVIAAAPFRPIVLHHVPCHYCRIPKGTDRHRQD